VTNLERIKTRYLKDPWPTRLAGIAAEQSAWPEAQHQPQQRTILSAQAKVWADQILELCQDFRLSGAERGIIIGNKYWGY
jgi:hypothetical protein